MALGTYKDMAQRMGMMKQSAKPASREPLLTDDERKVMIELFKGEAWPIIERLAHEYMAGVLASLANPETVEETRLTQGQLKGVREFMHFITAHGGLPQSQ